MRNRVAACLAALAFAVVALPACGDDDGKGAAEEVERGAKRQKDKREGSLAGNRRI